MRMDVDVLDRSCEELLLLPCSFLPLFRQQLDLISIFSLQLRLRDDLSRSRRSHILKIILVLYLRSLRSHDFLNAGRSLNLVFCTHLSDQKMQLF